MAAEARELTPARKDEISSRLLQIEAELVAQTEQFDVIDDAVIDERQREIAAELFKLGREVAGGATADTILAEVEGRGVHGSEGDIVARFADLSPSDLLAAVYSTVNREAVDGEFEVVEAIAMVMATRLEPEAWRRAAALADGDLTFEEPHPLAA